MSAWGARDERWILGRRLPREQRAVGPRRRRRATVVLLVVCLTIGLATVAILFLQSRAPDGGFEAGRGQGAASGSDGAALDGAGSESRSLRTGFHGLQDLSWSICDPVTGSAGEVAEGSVDVSADGRWAIQRPGDRVPIWSGTFEPIASSDVTGDGVAEAIVLTTCTTGASAEPWDLVIFQGPPNGSAPIVRLDQGMAAHYGRTLVGDVEAAAGAITYEVLAADDRLDEGRVRRVGVVHRWDGEGFVLETMDLGIEDYWGEHVR